MLTRRPRGQGQKQGLVLVKVNAVHLIVGLGWVVLVQQVRLWLVGPPVAGSQVLLLVDKQRTTSTSMTLQGNSKD